MLPILPAGLGQVNVTFSASSKGARVAGETGRGSDWMRKIVGIFEELTSYRLFASLRWASHLARGGTQSPPGRRNERRPHK